jgi:elongation factor G
MTSMFVPEPVISLAIKAKDNGRRDQHVQGAQPLHQGGPDLPRAGRPGVGETIIAGMGELHLDVYIERMKREYKAEVETAPPQVAYRETITSKVEFNYTHKKQTGGSGQYGRVAAGRAVREATSSSSTRSRAAPSRASSSRPARRASSR